MVHQSYYLLTLNPVMDQVRGKGLKLPHLKAVNVFASLVQGRFKV